MTQEHDQDRTLLEATARGDRRSFELLARRFEGPLYRFLLRATGSAALAEEARQLTLRIGMDDLHVQTLRSEAELVQERLEEIRRGDAACTATGDALEAAQATEAAMAAAVASMMVAITIPTIVNT